MNARYATGCERALDIRGSNPLLRPHKMFKLLLAIGIEPDVPRVLDDLLKIAHAGRDWVVEKSGGDYNSGQDAGIIYYEAVDEREIHGLHLLVHERSARH